MISRLIQRLADLGRVPDLLVQSSKNQTRATERKLQQLFREQQKLLAEQQHEILLELRQLNRSLARAEHRTASAEALRTAGLDLERTFGDPDIDQHVRQAIAAAPLLDDPMPHLIVNNLLPQATYEAILGGLPGEVCFSDRDTAKQNMRLVQSEGAPEWTVRMLTFLERNLIPQMMVPTLLDRFAPHIEALYTERFGSERGRELAAAPHIATSGRLMLRRPGYKLEPHLDPKRVVITTLLYFARPDDDESFGTAFYRMRGTPVIDRTNTFFPAQQGIVCDLVKSTSFHPNMAVAFLNHGGAHGAGISKSAPRDTMRYTYQFYISPVTAPDGDAADY